MIAVLLVPIAAVAWLCLCAFIINIVIPGLHGDDREEP